MRIRRNLMTRLTSLFDPMKTSPENPPAFPQTETLMNSGFPDIKVREVTGGMSMRDIFAGMTLQGIVLRPRPLVRKSDGAEINSPLMVAEYCYTQADAMLTARQTKP